MNNQELYYDILLKKYNILKKNLIIIEQTDEKIKEFKITIKEIDRIEQEKFKNELKIYKELTTNLKDEYDRLYNYINLLNDRNNKRTLMLEDYNNIVKESIDDLEEIEDYNNIDFYQERLENISEFLANDEKYNKYIDEKKEYLNIKEEYKKKYDNLNKTLDEYELNLLIKIKDIINSNKIYEELDFDNIDDSIDNYSNKLEEKERELNTYLNSYNALLNIDLVESEKEDYLSFVDEEKKDYINLLEKKYMLLLYKYINDNNIKKTLDIYDERLNKLKSFDLEENTYLNNVFDIINNYMSKKEYLNEINLTIESIDCNLEEVENKIDSLKLELNNPKIINLLKEFCIEKEYIVNNNDDGEEEKELKNETILEIDGKYNINTINDKEEEDSKIEVIESQYLEIPLKEDNNINDNEINSFADNIFEKEEDTFKEDSLNVLFEEKIEEPQEDYINLENKNEENIIEINDIKVFKENAIKEIKNVNEFMIIDKIRNNSLGIMKSVCESII